MVDHQNQFRENPFAFRPGFPAVKGGINAVKRMCPGLISLARGGLISLVVVDLDRLECPASLIRDFCGQPADSVALAPGNLILRVAVREIESWIMADRRGLADFLGIAEANFPRETDILEDPKRDLLNIIKRKGKRAWHRAMLPSGAASIGPEYNNRVCDFVDRSWDPVSAAKRSPSLARSLDRLLRQ